MPVYCGMQAFASFEKLATANVGTFGVSSVINHFRNRKKAYIMS